jgi:hypothetical protein
MFPALIGARRRRWPSQPEPAWLRLCVGRTTTPQKTPATRCRPAACHDPARVVTSIRSVVEGAITCYREGLPALAGAGKQNWRPFMRHHPWLARLLDGADLPDHGRPLVGTAGEIDGVPVQVGADGADADVQLGDDLGRLVLSDLTLFGVPAMRMASGDRCAGGRGA